MLGEHRSSPTAVQQLSAMHEFGQGLASGEWTRDEALSRAALALTAIRSDAHVISAQIERLGTDFGQEDSETTAVTPGDDYYNRLAKLAVLGVITREDPDDEPLLDKPPTLPADFSLDKAISDATEGILWVDPEQEAWRAKMTNQAGMLIKAFVHGQVAAGYPKSAAKEQVRQQFDEILDNYAGKSSYAATGFLIFVGMIQTRSGIMNVSSLINWGKRIWRHRDGR